MYHFFYSPCIIMMVLAEFFIECYDVFHCFIYVVFIVQNKFDGISQSYSIYCSKTVLVHESIKFPDIWWNGHAFD